MRVAHSHKVSKRERNSEVVDLFAKVSARYLRETVSAIAIPRHAIAEPENNTKVASWIASEFESFGYRVEAQGRYRNVVDLSANSSTPLVLVGAHYDSVPGCPGADDNASAVAVMLMCAKAVAGRDLSVGFVAFNREEDGFLGSEDFVRSLSPKELVAGCHVLEMLGYSSDEPYSQQIPPGLPIKIPKEGNFLGVLGNGRSNALVDKIVSTGGSYLPDFQVIGLKLLLGAERLIPNLNRSDHVPFWAAGIPATM